MFEARKRDPDGDWRIGFDDIGEVTVSTVWMAIDHNWSGEGPPLIFESMVFGGALDQECYRYSTREEAAAGHSRLLALVHADAQLPRDPGVAPELPRENS
jgi:hypothetical protein